MAEIHDSICTAETPKAIQVKRWIGDTRFWHWIPKSVITDDSEVWKDGDAGTLVVEDWFAEKEGLEP